MRSAQQLAAALGVLAVLGAPMRLAAMPLGFGEIQVFGIAVDVDTRPDVAGVQTTMTAVKDIPSGVQTVVGVAGIAGAANLPSGAMVRAELSGPQFPTPETLEAMPNQLMELPAIKAPGDYVLFNVRLEDAQGNVLLERDPGLEPIEIEVIDQLLISQVSSRALTAQEIEELGIVFDEDNFIVRNFVVGLTLGSEPVEVEIPIALPISIEALDRVAPPVLPAAALARRFDAINIPNFELRGFQLRFPPDVEDPPIDLPPIEGVIVIPGNIAFLNQFFSVFLQTTNTAPTGSGLVVEAARATIELPLGGDGIEGTGDDPLRVAETETDGVQETLPLVDADGRDAIAPQGTNSAQFLVEGLREGAHSVNFDIEGELFVPALGETFPVVGVAAGVVEVKNPTFDLVLAHPDVVREGEAYSILATVTNTSASPANFFQLQLKTRSLSGTRLAEGEEERKTLDTLAPGDSHTFEYRLVARTTGKVTGTVFLADEGINGSFVLTTGVGDTGIPLSPDTLILPQTVDFLPDDPDLVFAAVRLLGQAYSVATAPAGTLPPEIPRIRASFALDRGSRLAEEGLYIRFGDSPTAAAQGLVMDYFGNDLQRADELLPDDAAAADRLEEDIRAFDVLRRAADAGNDLSDVLGEILGQALPDISLSDLQRSWAERTASRPAHLSFGASTRGPPIQMQIRDAEGRVLGSLDEAGGPIARTLPFADRLPLRGEPDAVDEILFVAAPTSSRYDLAFSLPEAGAIRLSLVLPGGATLVHAIYPETELPAGSFGRLSWRPLGPSVLSFELDTDGDGVVDDTLEPISADSLVDPPPRLLGAMQWGKGATPESQPVLARGDPLGKIVGVLFDEELDVEAAATPENYAIEGNAVDSGGVFRPGSRLVFLALDRPVGPFIQRTLAAEGLADRRGHLMPEESAPIEPDPDLGAGGVFTGRVVTASGEPVAFAPVEYIQPVEVCTLAGAFCFSQDFLIANLQADAFGRFQIDFVLQNALGPFKLLARDLDSEQTAEESARIQFDGQRMSFGLVIRGFGSISGTALDEEGRPVPGSYPILATNLSTGGAIAGSVDESGNFTFEEVPVGNVALQAVRPSDGLTGVTTTNIPNSGTSVRQDIVMIPPNRYGTVAGRVLEADGVTGAAGVQVQVAGEVLTTLSLLERIFEQGVVGTARTDEEGFFSFDTVPTGDVAVRALRRETFEQADAAGFLQEGEALDLALVLPGGGGNVTGFVVDAFGQPVPGAVVAAGPILTATDATGRFELIGLPIGRITIYAQRAGSLALATQVVDVLGPGDSQEVLLSLEPTGTIAGMVVEADGVTPVPEQRVQLWVEDRAVIEETITDEDGNYQFSGFPVNSYSVRAVRESDMDGGMTFTAIRFAGDVRDADIRFRGLGEIRGRVIQSNGTPVISDVVIVRKVWRIATTSQGRPFNPYVEWVLQIAELSPELRETVEAGLALAGTTLENFDPEFFVLADEAVLLSSNRLGPNGEVTGEFHFAGDVTGGPFTVSAFGPFLSPAEVRGTMPQATGPEGPIVDVGDIVLEPATGSVVGTVFLPDGETPVGADVAVKIRSFDNSGNVRVPGGAVSQPVLPEIEALTDENGRFEFPLVLRGRFAVTADTGVPDPGIAAGSAAEMETELFESETGERLLNVRLRGQGQGVVPAGQTVELPIRLHDVAAVHVQVVENDQVTPVPFAEVTLRTRSSLDDEDEPGRVRQIADEQGFIDFFPVTEGTFSIDARKPDSPAMGRATGDVPVNPPNGLEIPVTVTLGAVTSSSGEVVEAPFFGTVEGTVFRADGTPLSNPAQVTIRASGVSILTTSGELGRYRAEDVPGGFFRVDAIEPFTARTGSGQGIIESDGDVVEVPVTLVGLGTVSGEVFDHDGSQTVPGADVTLIPAGNFSAPLVSRTDSLGSYSLPGVPLGPYMVKAVDVERKLSGEANDEMLADGDLNTTDVFLEPSGQITGVVYGPGVLLDDEGHPVDASGAPLTDPPVVANAEVVIRKGAGTVAFEQRLQTDPFGRFASSDSLTLGTYAVTARPALGGDGDSILVVLGFDGDVAEVALAFRGTGRVEGVVLDPLGSDPVDLAEVQIVSESPFSSGSELRITEADGEFAFEDVPVGKFSIVVSGNLSGATLGAAAMGEITAHGQVLAFRDGDEDPDHEAIRLEDSGVIRGEIVLPDGETLVEGAIVTLRGPGLDLVRIAAIAGDFRFEIVPLGSYQLTVIDPVTNGRAARSVGVQTNGQIVDLGSIAVDTEAPRVVSTAPSSGATSVNPGSTIRVTFSELIDPASVTPQSFRVLAKGAPVAGSRVVSDFEPAVSFVPNQSLPDLTAVRVELAGDQLGFQGEVVARGIGDLAGRGLVQDFSFSFTTADTKPPTLVGISPAPGTTDVALDTVIRVEFSEPIASASVQSFTLTEGGSPVAGSLNATPILGGRVFVFTPAAPLLPDRDYSAALTGPVRDLSGNASALAVFGTSFSSLDTLAPEIQALFAPAAPIQGSVATVTADVGAADDVAHVEFRRGTALAAVDATAPYVASLPLDGPVGSEVVVSAIAVDRAGNRGNAQTLVLQIQENQPPVVTLTSPDPGGVVGVGNALAVRVEAEDDVGVAQVSFAVNGGALGSGTQGFANQTPVSKEFAYTVPANLPVGSEIRIRASALDSTGQSAQTGEVVVTLEDDLPPAVTIASPASGTIVDPGQDVAVIVRAEDGSGVSQVSLDSGTIAGVVSRSIAPPASPVLETFALAIPVDAGAGQRLTLIGGAQDSQGNAGQASIEIIVRDDEAPTVTATAPGGSFVNSPGQVTVQVSAQDTLGVVRIDAEAEGLPRQTRTFPSTPSTSRSFVIEIPAGLPLGSQIAFVGSARDASGNVGQSEVLTLVTADRVAPTVAFLAPEAGIAVPTGSSFEVRVRAEDAVGVSAITLEVTGETGARVAPITPVAILAERSFTVDVPGEALHGSTIELVAGATDEAGNAASVARRSVVVNDVTPPVVTNVSPPDGTTEFSTQGTVVVQFSEELAPASVGPEAVRLLAGAAPIPTALLLASDARSARLTPDAPLEGETEYTVQVQGVLDSQGNAMEGVFESRFTTRSLEPDPLDASFIDPVPYRSEQDSPLLGQNGGPFELGSDRFFLETFEDGVLDLPRTSAAAGAVFGPDPAADSVDADDGAIDGFGVDGRSWQAPADVTFRFDRIPLDGLLPTHVGVVWTGSESADGQVTITLEVFDAAGQSLGVSAPFPVPASPDEGTTAEDRFFGASFPGGIAALRIIQSGGGDTLELDHVQYGILAREAELDFTTRVATAPLGGVGLATLELSQPLADTLPVTIQVGDPTLVGTPAEPVLIAAGETRAEVPLTGFLEGGTALIAISPVGSAFAIVSVSAPPSGIEVDVVAPPVGVSVLQPPASLVLAPPASGEFTVGVPLLGAPATGGEAVEVSSSDESVAVVQATSLPVGSTQVEVTILPGNEGEALITVTVGSERTTLRVLVGSVPPDRIPAVVARPVGISVFQPPASLVVAPLAVGVFTVQLPLLDAPAVGGEVVTSSSSDPDVATVSSADLPVGETQVTLNVATHLEGTAVLTIESAGQRANLRVVVGELPLERTPAVVAPPVGIHVSSPPPGAFLHVPVGGGSASLELPLLDEPATSTQQAEASSSDEGVVRVDSVSLQTGETVVQVNLTTGVEGEAIVVIESEGARRTLRVVVGPLDPGRMPALVAPVVGIEVEPAP